MDVVDHGVQTAGRRRGSGGTLAWRVLRAGHLVLVARICAQGVEEGGVGIVEDCAGRLFVAVVTHGGRVRGAGEERGVEDRYELAVRERHAGVLGAAAARALPGEDAVEVAIAVVIYLRVSSDSHANRRGQTGEHTGGLFLAFHVLIQVMGAAHADLDQRLLLALGARGGRGRSAGGGHAVRLLGGGGDGIF